MTEAPAGLESEPWHDLRHHYGTVEDVPELLRTIAASSAAGDGDATSEAADELSNAPGGPPLTGRPAAPGPSVQ
ncbi:hypothetical protein [Streptomyces sp. YGL11-2]|uniref:hypothetical protein n=1 Tax=Streptomyces sp. YGL11-2 TaxID=3414028 RepID=UPI003CE99BD7